MIKVHLPIFSLKGNFWYSKDNVRWLQKKNALLRNINLARQELINYDFC